MGKKRITYATAITYLAGLRALDTHTILLSNDGKEQAQTLPTRFAPDALLAIAINVNRLMVVQKDLQEANAKLVRSLTGGLEQIAPPPSPGKDASAEEKATYKAAQKTYQEQIAKWRVDTEELQNKTVDVELRTIPAWTLRLEDHAIQPSALAAIEPLIEWDAKPPATATDKKKAA
jgi:hypothetical protein